MYPCVRCHENKAPNPNWTCPECTQELKAKVQAVKEQLPPAKRKAANIMREVMRQEQGQQRNQS